MHHHLTHLKKNGLNVVTRSPWHYQVVHSRIIINVWPTSRKWMVAYDTGASLYKDASDLFRIVTKVIEERAPIVMLSCDRRRARMEGRTRHSQV